MKILMILGLLTLLGPAGCSTYKHMLEPGHDKRQEVSPERRGSPNACTSTAACCKMSVCNCGNCNETEPCGCKHESQYEPGSGVTP